MKGALSQKIFWAFFALSSLSFGMGIMLIFAFFYFEQNNEKVQELKEFQHKLNLMRNELAHVVHPSQKKINKNFHDSIQKVIDSLDKIYATGILNHSKNTERKKSLSHQIQFWQKSFSEFKLESEIYNRKLKLIKNEINNQKNLLFREKVRVQIPLGQFIKNRINRVLALVRERADTHYVIRDIKNALKTSSTRNMDIRNKLLKEIDQIYLLKLSIKSKTDYFYQSSLNFFEIAQQSINAALYRNRQIAAIMQFISLFLILFTLFITIYFWRYFAKIVNSFINSLSNAIEKTKKKEYDYKLPTLAEPELNETLEYMQSLSSQLGYERNQRERSEKVKDRFIAGMSHKIRTPLHSIVANIDLLLIEKTLNHGFIRNLQMVRESANELLHLINEVFDFSRFRSTQLQIENRYFNITELLDSLFQELIFAHPRKCKQLDFTYSVGEKIPRNFHADANKIRQILYNILDNGLKFTESGFVHLKLSLQGQEKNDDPTGIKGNSLDKNKIMINFEIRDNGPGIDQDKLDIIFHDFEQINPSFSGRGPGLGLSISQKLIHAMGSDIHVQSKANQGSIFSFTLELEAVELESKRDKESAPDNLLQWCQHHTNDWKVVLAEDNLINQKIFEAMMKKIGLSINTVENGKELLDFLEQDPDVHLIFMDIEMPVMDGLMATQTLRKSPQWSHLHEVPIIACTAHAFNENRQEFLNNGLNDLLLKPFTLDDLCQRIYNIRNMVPRN